MTYPNGETEQERRVSRYKILNYKPKGTPEEQAMSNATMLEEFLRGDDLQDILPFRQFRSLQRVVEQQNLSQNRSVRLTLFVDQNSQIQSLDVPRTSNSEFQTVSSVAVFSNQAAESQVYSFGATETWLPGDVDTNTDVAEKTKQFLSDYFDADPQKTEAFVNNVRTSRTENKAQSFIGNGVKWMPNPNHALFIPASIEGTYSFPFFFDGMINGIESTDTWSPPS